MNKASFDNWWQLSSLVRENKVSDKHGRLEIVSFLKISENKHLNLIATLFCEL